MELRYLARFEKFNDSLESLRKIQKLKWPEDEDLFGFIWCGVIAKFCITFDLSYKLAKDVLVEHHGITNFAKGSPREVLKAAYAANVIDDEKWLTMLRDRNEIVHEYKDFSSVDIWCGKIVDEYIPIMDKLRDYVQTLNV
jgi:nucleotidyltransferase substrate binding protein (TIGR01987 family)